MEIYPVAGYLCISMDSDTLISLNRPESMLELLNKQFNSEAGWSWELKENKNVLKLKPHQANMIVREGKAKISFEKELLGTIYDFLLENNLLNTPQYIYA